MKKQVKKPLRKSPRKAGCLGAAPWSVELLDNPCKPAETPVATSLWHDPHAVDTPGLYVARLITGEFQVFRLVVTLSSATQQLRRWCLAYEASPAFELNLDSYESIISVFGPIDEV